MRVLLVAFLIMPLLSGSPCAEEETKPIVFGKREELREFGIALPDWGAGRSIHHLPHKCDYYYGDGGYDLSLSNEIVDHFKAKGFSIQSLCMGLLSPFRFDPETGRRLQTYILADLQAVRDGTADAGTVTEELPMDLPECLKNARLYSDCELNYDPFASTQKKLSSAEKQDIAQKTAIVADGIKARMNGAQDAADRCRELEITSRCFAIEIQPASSSGPDEEFKFPTKFDEEASALGISHVDVTDDIPGGFGYALYLSGAAGPDPAEETVELITSARGFLPSSPAARRAAPWRSAR